VADWPLGEVTRIVVAPSIAWNAVRRPSPSTITPRPPATGVPPGSRASRRKACCWSSPYAAAVVSVIAPVAGWDECGTSPSARTSMVNVPACAPSTRASSSHGPGAIVGFSGSFQKPPNCLPRASNSNRVMTSISPAGLRHTPSKRCLPGAPSHSKYTVASLSVPRENTVRWSSAGCTARTARDSAGLSGAPPSRRLPSTGRAAWPG